LPFNAKIPLGMLANDATSENWKKHCCLQGLKANNINKMQEAESYQ
jgi:hypothetical protein